MRALSAIVVVVVVVIASGCASAPAPGGACTADDSIKCQSGRSALACESNLWVEVPCDGANGCVETDTTVTCDVSIATAGRPCPPWNDGSATCSLIPSAVLQCAGGVWTQTVACTGTCTSAGGQARCVDNATGGGGGSTGGGGGSTGGGGGSTGGGGGSTGGGGGSTGGGGGSTGGGGGSTGGGGGSTGGGSGSCSPTSCSGCCSNGQCIPSPANQTADFCGQGGNACTRCSTFGLTCDATRFVCTSGAGGGGGSTGGGGGTSDPCQGVPTSGVCLSSAVVQFCSVPTGQGTPSVQTYQCAGGSSCQASSAGASCVVTGACTSGDARCSNGQLQSCNTSGTWDAAAACASGQSCHDSGIGAYCAPTAGVTTVSGTIAYQVKKPTSNYSDWGALGTAPAAFVSILSYQGSGSTAVLLDIATTDASGAYQVRIPTAPTTNDRIIVAAAGGDGLNMRYAVMDPQLGTGTQSAGQEPTSPRYWTWAVASNTLSNGSSVTLTAAQWSGALNLFDKLQGIYARNKSLHHGTAGKPIVLWMGQGTEWDCGACFLDSPSSATGFDTQLFIPSGATDEDYWSDSTVSHELGHWTMASWGSSPNEGGTHYLGNPTFEGQAWSEGWATYHSGSYRRSPIQYDKQSGTFFWFDLTAGYSPGLGGTALRQSTPAGGLLQKIDENEVAAIVYALEQTDGTALQQIHNALASPHMNSTPWARGYTRHTWSLDSQGNFLNVVDTGTSAPILPDLLDAVRCQGMAAASTTAAAQSSTHYPYPSASPICHSTLCYGCASGSSCLSGTTTAACGTGAAACTACSSGQTCTQGVCQ
jgi:hypothetical protein